MGIDFSHGTAHWSYSGFMEFRNKLANQIAINLNEMEGFDGHEKWNMESDPIMMLLNHSDCDGELTAEQCRVIAPRLKELIADWEDNCSALELAESMEEAAELEETLIFK